MTIEEAIKELEDGEWFEAYCTLPSRDVPDNEVFCHALDMAIAALRAQQEAEKNEPLVLDELRQMDGEPVYVVPKEDWYGRREWAIVDRKACLCRSPASYYFFENYWNLWLAYRRPPAREEGPNADNYRNRP